MIKCMAELPLNDKALKHNCFTFLDDCPIYEQFIKLVVQYGEKTDNYVRAVRSPSATY